MESEVNKLILMVGLPRSGKTTKALEISKGRSAPIVNPDSIRLALHGDAYIQSAEPYVWAIATTMVRALFLAGHDTVIVDVCNNTVKRRNEWKCYDEAWEREYVVVDTSVSVCLKRATGNCHISSIIERMYKEHEPVTEAENMSQLLKKSLHEY